MAHSHGASVHIRGRFVCGQGAGKVLSWEIRYLGKKNGKFFSKITLININTFFYFQFHSHQIFHCFVIAGAFVHYHGISLMALYRLKAGECPLDEIDHTCVAKVVQEQPQIFSMLNVSD